MGRKTFASTKNFQGWKEFRSCTNSSNERNSSNKISGSFSRGGVLIKYSGRLGPWGIGPRTPVDTKTHGCSSICMQATARCACTSLHAHGFRATFGTHGKFGFCFLEPAKFFSRLGPPKYFPSTVGDPSLDYETRGYRGPTVSLRFSMRHASKCSCWCFCHLCLPRPRCGHPLTDK